MTPIGTFRRGQCSRAQLLLDAFTQPAQFPAAIILLNIESFNMEWCEKHVFNGAQEYTIKLRKRQHPVTANHGKYYLFQTNQNNFSIHTNI